VTTYDPQSERLHHTIVSLFMDGTRAQTRPQVIFTAGGVGTDRAALAGRSTSAKNLPTPRGHVYVDPDAIKPMLPDYDAPTDDGSHDAEAADVAKLLTAIAVKRKRHLVIAGTGASTGFKDMLTHAKATGYKVTARYAHQQAPDDRVAATHHHKVHKNFVDSRIAKAPVKVEIYSTAGSSKPPLIASKPEAGPMQVHKPQQYAQFTEAS
jgi:predicted ABC-type ATPase